MIRIQVIDRDHAADIRIPNEPFALVGRMIPRYLDEQWGYDVEMFDTPSEMCFPDENYDYDAMCKDHVFVGAYEDDRCIGLAVLADGFFKHMYLEDLKVDRAYRGTGVGRRLIRTANEIALDRGYHGLYTIGQDNNLIACRFYLSAGFRIGGLDTEVYKGTSQEGKADIIFYLD
ncbi:MAG: GNAT family N-acetyltransferase [Firmicutes bacterium]|nr:GNAT family N-acetyltransferase [Bacillota bacterium]